MKCRESRCIMLSGSMPKFKHKEYRLPNASADEKAAGIAGIKAEHLLYASDLLCNPWLTLYLISFTMAFLLHGAKALFTPSSKQGQ